MKSTHDKMVNMNPEDDAIHNADHWLHKSEDARASRNEMWPN